MAVLSIDSKCSHTTCMLRFLIDRCLALEPNLFFEMGSDNYNAVDRDFLQRTILLQTRKKLQPMAK